MVCKRALKDLGVKLPVDGFSEKEIRDELKVETHEQVHQKVENMSREEFKRFVEYLQWKLKQRAKKVSEGTNEKEKLVPTYIA